MANNHQRLHIRGRENNDTGFSSTLANNGGRFINKDGSMNMRREGISIFDRFSVFQAMLTIPTWKFITVILAFYFGLSFLFAGVYYVIGVDELQGLTGATDWQKLKDVFYFSTQTFTTVGYGRVNPIGDGANIVASIEALTGFLSFAIATGLIYGRFARPKSYLLFSEHALISPYQGKTGLMFRLVSYKDRHTLTDVSIIVTLGMQQPDEHGKMHYRFYQLDLERNKIDSLAFNWTIVHPITEESPLYGMNAKDMEKADVEVYVSIRGFDEIFSATVQNRTSYIYSEILFHKKFASMYKESENGQSSILEMHKLNNLVDVK